MNTNLDLNKTQKASYKLAAFGDGLTDLTLGLILIALGLFPITRAAFGPTINLVFFLVLLLAISGITMGVRLRLTPSRLGLVTFGPSSRTRLKTGLLVTTLLLAASAVLWGLAGQGWFLPSPSWLSSYGFDIFFALVILGIFFTMAYSLGVTRYYLYGLLFGGSMLLQGIVLEGLYEGVPMLAAGGIVTVIGVVLLARFLKHYPPLASEEA